MPISRELFETRLTGLKQQLEQIRQQYIATTGAIADIEYWLSELDKPTEPTTEG